MDLGQCWDAKTLQLGPVSRFVDGEDDRDGGPASTYSSQRSDKPFLALGRASQQASPGKINVDLAREAVQLRGQVLNSSLNEQRIRQPTL